MATLYDDIRAGRIGIGPPPSVDDIKKTANWRTFYKHVMMHMRGAEVFRIDNVAKYYWEKCCQTWDLFEDFPNLAPPFPAFWMEYPPPKRVLERVSEDMHDETGPTILKDAGGMYGRTGVLFLGRHGEWPDPSSAEPMVLAKYTPTSEPVAFSVIIATFEEQPSRDAVVFGRLMCSYHLNAEGRPIRFSTLNFGADGADEKYLANHKAGFIRVIPGLLAVCFLHCKNVAVQTTQPPHKLSKKFEKKTGLPLVRYKVLDIEPMKRILEHEGGSAHTGIKRALHICRGHFKDYRESGLGRYHVKGLWWWSDQVRGSAESGIVDKDYNVNAPEASDGETKTTAQG